MYRTTPRRYSPRIWHGCQVWCRPSPPSAYMILSILFLAAWSPLHQMGDPRMSVIWDFFWEMDCVAGVTWGQGCFRRRRAVRYRRPSRAFCGIQNIDFISISRNLGRPRVLPFWERAAINGKLCR
ncbi:hypothetical protein FB451DRAFT_1203246 [Mycena latifolia]|nr:hypothetical protein FB451DRAFT_1203246 [Mycena latifolia]